MKKSASSSCNIQSNVKAFRWQLCANTSILIYSTWKYHKCLCFQSHTCIKVWRSMPGPEYHCVPLSARGAPGRQVTKWVDTADMYCYLQEYRIAATQHGISDSIASITCLTGRAALIGLLLYSVLAVQLNATTICSVKTVWSIYERFSRG